MRALSRAVLAVAATALTSSTGCGQGAVPPPPAPIPAPPAPPAPAPVAPAAAPVPAPAPPTPGVDPQDKVFEFQLSRARDAAARAATIRDGASAQEAFEAFMAATRIRPKDPVPPAEAGLLALDLGDRSMAARMLQYVFDIAPTSGAFHFLKGCVLQLGDQYRDAVEEFRAAKEGTFRPTQADDRFFECTIGLGLQLVEAHLFDEAVKVLQEGVAMRPNHPLVCRALYNLGLAYRRLLTVKESEKFLRLCIQRFPYYAPAYGELGDLLVQLDRFEEAVEILNMSVKVDPKYSRGYLLLGSGLTAQGRFKEAEKAFKDFLERFPPDVDSEFHLGVFYFKRMEPEKAVEHLQRSLAIDPGAHIRALYFLSLCYRDLGRTGDSAEMMRKWTEADEKFRREDLLHLQRGLEKAGGAKEAPKDAPEDAPKDAPKDAPPDPPAKGK